MYYFCTYFDQHYLTRGLVLFKSLRDHCHSFRLWALCMDDMAYRVLAELNFPELVPIALAELEKTDVQLREAKTNRSRIEYYFTCTPSLPLFILNNWPEVDIVTYLDADLYFFDSPGPIFEEMAHASIAIIGHRFPPHLKYLERTGIYNVGWLSFRRDVHGIACLNWWRDSCIEWCYERNENGRYADQKYLDDWPSRFKGVKVIDHKGANLAPWNVGNGKLSLNGYSVLVGGQPLVFYHFHGTKEIVPWVYALGLQPYGSKSTALLRNSIYRPYIRSLLIERQTFLKSTVINQDQEIRWLGKKSLQVILRKLYRIAQIPLGIISGHFIVARF